MALRLKGPKNDPILLAWYLPVLSKGSSDVTLACFEIINWIPFIKPLRPYDARVLRIFSDQGSEYLNKIFRNEAMHLGIAMVQSLSYQPSSNGIAEKAVQVAKAGARRLIEASGLPPEYWNYALAYLSEFMRHAALDLPFKLPAFGELVAVWHSRSKETIHALSPRGQVGRMLTCDIMGTKECKILVGDPEEPQIVKGLKPHPVPAEICKVQRPEALPDQWTDLSMRAVRRLWTYTQDSTGVPVWMNNTSVVTSYMAPFAVELTEPVPSADIASSTTVCVPSQLATWVRLDDKVKCYVTTTSRSMWERAHRRVVTDRDRNVVIQDEIVAGSDPIAGACEAHRDGPALHSQCRSSYCTTICDQGGEFGVRAA
eukprot:3824736-Amphidinium_carterae.3